MAGVIAAGAFLGMHLLLGSPLLWLSAGLSVATYLGVRLLSSPAKPVDKAEESVDDINAIASLGQKLPKPELRQQCTQIGVKARTLLAQFQKSGGSSEAEFLVQQYLEQTRKGLELFLGEQSRSNLTRTESLEVLSHLLATVSERFDKLQTSLDSQDDQALAGELKLLTRTLNDLDQFSVTLNQGNG